MPTMPSSPRKTRSHSRLVSGSYGYDEAPSAGSSPIAKTVPADLLGYTPVPVMKASSMEPVNGQHPGAEKRARHKISDFQLGRLEELYQENTHPSRQAKEDLAREIGMTVKSVLIWFQNRRQDRRRKKTTSKGTPKRVKTTQDPHLQSAAQVQKAKPIPPRKKQAAAFGDKGPGSPKQATPVHRQSGKQASRPRSSRTISSQSDDSAMEVEETSSSSTSTAATSVHVKHLPKTYIARSPSSSLDSSSSDSPDALWRFVVKAPPPPPPVGSILKMGLGSSRQPFGNIQGSHLSQRKPDLEWACANSAARRKHGYYVYRDEDDSDGESSEVEGQSTTGTKNSSTAQLKRKRRLRETSPGFQTAIPMEYDLLLPPDLVLGASLLLTLKHSADTVKQSWRGSAYHTSLRLAEIDTCGYSAG
ncbi:homeobox-domain-containing protein [Trametes cingulata]|nr:homeobox-domain-containing protein [Trametes cingulata]